MARYVRSDSMLYGVSVMRCKKCGGWKVYLEHDEKMTARHREMLECFVDVGVRCKCTE